MARVKYKQKPQFWWCVQYSGTNSAEMIAHCPQCVVDPKTGKLMFNGLEVVPTNWILQDNGGLFSMMIDSQFNAFFQLDTGAMAKPAPEK
jgi:hypothetical protein